MEMQFMVKMILVIVVVLVLLAIPANIQKVSKIFGSLGEESDKMVKLRALCNQRYDDKEDLQGCGLDMAIATLEAGEVPIIAESWLRKEIELTRSTKILEECFNFARDTLYPSSKDWVGAIETYNLLSEKLQSKELDLAKDDAQINVNIDDIKKIYEQLGITAGGSSVRNKQLLENNRETFDKLFKESLTLYYKNKMDDKLILSDCNKIYDSTSTDDRSKERDACNIFSRASLKYGCFLKEIGECISCYYYALESLDPKIDICSGYFNEGSCKADPCNIGYCVWESDRCVEKFSPTIVAGNYWDLS